MSLRVAVLISGHGSNLQAILDQADGYRVVLVISNEKKAYGLRRAEEAGIPATVVSHRDFETREAFEEKLIELLDQTGIDVIALAGFMRILTKKFVGHYPKRILNIHPALLPSFPGINAIEKAWRSGVEETGVTVHFVDQGVDTGPILLQEKIPIDPGESLESLTERIHEVEHRLCPKAIRLLAKGDLCSKN